VISVLATFLVFGLAVGAFRFGEWLGRKWKARGEGWWKVWRWRVWGAGWFRGWRMGLSDARRGEAEREALLVPEG